MPQDALLPVRIALAQSNLDDGEHLLLDVSNPQSPNYGKHWTAEEVAEYFKPSDETVATVRQWLVEFGGIDSDSITQTDNKAWLAFTATAGQMESLLHTEYFEHEDKLTGRVMPACTHYHIPANLQDHIDFISPGVKLLAPPEKLPPPHKRAGLEFESGAAPQLPDRLPRALDATEDLPHDLKYCSQQMTPACITALYDISEGHLAHPDNSMASFQQGNHHWNQHDLNSFFTKWYPRIPNGTHPKSHSVDGGEAENAAPDLKRRETMTDLDMAYPIGLSNLTHCCLSFVELIRI